MPDKISEETSERVSHLIGEYARLCGRTHAEVAHALLDSRTLRRLGYSHAQRGLLTEEQGRAAIRVLDYWIGAKSAKHQPSPHQRQPDA